VPTVEAVKAEVLSKMFTPPGKDNPEGSWPKHSFPTNSGPLLQLVSQCARRLRKNGRQRIGDRATLTGILFVP
jgi:hypothetical protein